MAVTIELKPEIEARLKNEAAVRGIPVEDYLESVIESEIADKGTASLVEEMTPAERARAWEAWAASHSPETPVIFDDSRESIYGDDKR